MAFTAVNFRILVSQPFLNIFSIIDTRTNISDPRDSTGGRKFVYDSDPYIKGLDFGDFPYIVVKMPIIEKSAPTTDGKHKNILWTQNIIIRTVRKGSSGGGKVDTGRTDMLTIEDDLNETFMNATIKQDLHNNGYKKINLDKINADTDNISQEDVYESEYVLTYQQRMRISD